MRFQNALDNARLTIFTLLGALTLSFVVNLFLGFGLMTSPDKVRVYLPPQIPQNGLTTKTNEIPAATIYAFAYYVWQNLNYWPGNGMDDYKANISKLSPFLTPRFIAFLRNDYDHRQNGGELHLRISAMQGLYGSAFQASDVTYLGHDTWQVKLTMRLTERMNMNDQTVKDTEIQYVLRVVRYPINANVNPWGLALDGFAQDPERVNTHV